jgi:hypothetical protein
MASKGIPLFCLLELLVPDVFELLGIGSETSDLLED